MKFTKRQKSVESILKCSPFFCAKIYVMRIIGFCILAFSILFINACASNTYMSIKDIPIPNNATRKIPEGAFEIKLDLISNRILNSLKEDHSKVEDKLLFLPNDTEWNEIVRFYNRNLKENGFEKVSSKQNDRKNYHLAIWKRKGFLSDESVAVALINIGNDTNDKHLKFLNVFLAE